MTQIGPFCRISLAAFYKWLHCLVEVDDEGLVTVIETPELLDHHHDRNGWQDYLLAPPTSLWGSRKISMHLPRYHDITLTSARSGRSITTGHESATNPRGAAFTTGSTQRATRTDSRVTGSEVDSRRCLAPRRGTTDTRRSTIALACEPQSFLSKTTRRRLLDFPRPGALQLLDRQTFRAASQPQCRQRRRRKTALPWSWDAATG